MRLGLAFLLLAVSLAVASRAYAQDNCVTLAYTIQASVAPSYYWYYPLDFGISGSVTVTLYPQLYSDTPVRVVVYDLTRSRELASTSPYTRLSEPLTVTFSSPRRVGLAIFNPSSSTARVRGAVKATLCGNPALAWALEHSAKLSNTVLGPAAPTGIADFGIALVNGTYTVYSYNFSGARAEVSFSPDFRAVSYSYPYSTRGFSVQLNLNLKVATKAGSQQVYWVQEVLIASESGVFVNINIWNTTVVSREQVCSLAQLNPYRVSGKGYVRHYSGEQGGCAGDVYVYAAAQTPFAARVSLEVGVETTGDSVRVSFYRDGSLVDSVIITPSGGVSWAGFVVEPLLWEWAPLNAELVVAGQSSRYPVAVVESGSVTLKLIYLREGRWAVPVSAWSVGGNTYERAVAGLQQVGGASVTVGRGEPRVFQAWLFLVTIRTPLGVFYSTSLDISRYIAPVIDFGNGTRLVEPRVYIDGKPAGSMRVWPGAVVEVYYTRQYRVSVYLPTGGVEKWVAQGIEVGSLVPEEIDLGNGTRYKLEGIYFSGGKVGRDYRVEGPGEIRGVYRRQFLVSIVALETRTAWLDEGSGLEELVPSQVDFGNRTRLVSPVVHYRGLSFNLAGARVIGPGVYTVTYTRQYLVRVFALNASYEEWVDSGKSITVRSPSFNVSGVYIAPVAYEVNGTRRETPEILVKGPVDVRVVYNATARLGFSSLGLPALYAEAALKCGGKAASKTLVLAWDAMLTLGDVNTTDCSVTYTSVPSWPAVLLLTAIGVAVTVRSAARKLKRGVEGAGGPL
ncbi:thermopsin family protease [Infirmifilum lucidum]|uniref:Thermopsin family protease n=1 Tax=Infirmifilum lucidum TaxID=2776706 RepID=A0A7L9FK21_9CREN|nr:thermopsin family protease [Infirmifilum lucidum]QOJ79145.1 thermopsin family protease [Infirmifilum lucidum]